MYDETDFFGIVGSLRCDVCLAPCGNSPVFSAEGGSGARNGGGNRGKGGCHHHKNLRGQLSDYTLPARLCGMQHVVEADGSVYPCDFYVLDQYRLGNLRTDSFQEINARRKEIGFVEQSMAIDPECRACPYISICRGGCRRHRPVNPDGSLGKNIFCESYRQFFAYAGPRLAELARMAAKNLR